MSSYNVHRVRFVELQPRSITSLAYDCHMSGRVAIGREDGSIEVRLPRHGWWTERWLPGAEGRSIERLAWCAGRLFSAGLTGEIVEWDLARLSPHSSYDSYGGPVWCLRVNASQNRLAAGCEDGSIRIFEVLDNGGLCYERHLDRQEGRILSLAWSADGGKIVTGGADCTIRVYNTKTGHVTSRMTTDKLRDRSTLVWSVDLLADGTLVSGDSLGNVQFWDSETGTLTQSFRSHLADVLTVCATTDGRSVFAAGVDSKVVKFTLLSQDTNDEDSSDGNHSNVARWVCVKNVRATSHDTRCLIYIDGSEGSKGSGDGGAIEPMIVSGGVDPRFIVYPLTDFSSQTFLKYSCVPDESPCQLARSESLLAFRDQRNVLIWKLEPAASPRKLLEVQAKGDQHLLCHDISSCGTFLAFSSVSSCTLFRISKENGKNSIEKMKSVVLPPTAKLAFTRDEKLLVLLTLDGRVLILDLVNSTTEEISFPNDVKNSSNSWSHLEVCDSGKLFVTYDCSGQGLAFCTLSRLFLHRIPSLGPDDRITRVRFRASKLSVLLVTARQRVFEYSVTKEKLLPWCSRLSESGALAEGFRFENEPIKSITCNPREPKELFLHTKESLGKITYGTDMTGMRRSRIKGKSLKRSRKSPFPFHTMIRYTNIVFVEFLETGDLVVVERPITDVLAKLPPPLKIKKFGR